MIAIRKSAAFSFVLAVFLCLAGCQPATMQAGPATVPPEAPQTETESAAPVTIAETLAEAQTTPNSQEASSAVPATMVAAIASTIPAATSADTPAATSADTPASLAESTAAATAAPEATAAGASNALANLTEILSGNERVDANVKSVFDEKCTSDDPKENLTILYDWIFKRFGHRNIVVDTTGGYTQEKIYELADDMLLRRRGSCEHFAALFYVFAQRLGYNAYMVDGRAYFGDWSADNSDGWGPHAWVIVEIDGEYYHFDQLYDDTYSDGYHNFFMKKDADIEHLHSWDRSAYPVCE